MLGLSVKTIETHRSNILIKLKMHSIVELVMYAVRNGIVSVRTPVVVMPDAHSGNGHAVIGMPA
jgi:Bacterial regulatory proteins, luxR family